MYNEVLYRAFSVGLNKRQLIKADDNYYDTVGSIIEKNPDGDYYESLYLYNQDHYNEFKKTKSLSGISDNVTDKIVFDFDSKNNLEDARKDAKELYSRLINFGFNKKAINTYFSGSKGLHIELKIDSLINKETLSNILDNLTEGLPTFDVKIRDNARLFRFPLTKHPETSKYKIPLTEDQLNNWTMDQIKEMASYVNVDFDLLQPMVMNPEKTIIPAKAKLPVKKSIKKVEIDMQKQTDRPDMSKKPKHLTAPKFALQEGYFEEGERNEACMILASTYKYLGYNQEHTYNIIKATLRMRCHRLGLPEYDKKELWTTIIQPIYAPTWKGGTFTEEDGLLKRTIERYDLDKIDIYDAGLVSLTSIADQYRDFATNIAANTIKLGIEQIDQKLRITTSMLVAFLAAPSAGKSSVSFGILNTVSKTGEKSLFFSMDMSIPQVYQRLIQRHTGHHSDLIVQNYEKGNQLAIENYDGILAKEYPNVKFSFKSGLTTDQIRATIVQEQQSTGVMPKLVILDYLECISAGGIADSTQSKAVIATALKGICNELGICIILLTQPRMAAGGPAGELNSYTDIKGSSVISEASATVITMSRPGFSPKNPEDDNYVTLNIVKNRMGVLSSTDLYWDGLTGNIRSLSSEEENDLKALRAAIVQSKNADKNEDMW